MYRKNKAKSIIIFLTVFTLLSSSIGIASTLNPIPSFSMEDIRQITNSMDTGTNKALKIQIQVARPDDIATTGWSNEIKVYTGETIRFRTTIQNTVNYDLQDVNIISVLPPQDTLSFLENSIFTSKISTHQIIENNLIITFDELKISEILYIEYEMLALVETTVEGVTNTVAATANIHSKYYNELNVMKEEYIQKTNQLNLITNKISQNQVAYADSLAEIGIINTNIALANEQISILEPQITSLNSEILSLNSNLEIINTDVTYLTLNLESINLGIATLNDQIAKQQLTIQNFENSIILQTQTIQALEQNLADVNLEIQTALQNSNANQEYVQGLIDTQSTLEVEMAQINQNIDAEQLELTTAQTDLDSMIALQDQLASKISALILQIQQESHLLQETQTLYTSALQQLESAQTELAAATQSLTELEANILSVIQQLEDIIAQEKVLANQELEISLALQADIDAIAVKTNEVSQLEDDLQIANQNLLEVTNNLNLELSASQELQNSIQQTTQELNNLVTLENDLLSQESTAQQALQSTIVLLTQEEQVLIQIQDQINTLESQISNAAIELSYASDSLASVQAAIQLKAQQIAQNTVEYEQLLAQQAETDQLLQDAIAQISAKTLSLEKKQLLYADLTQQIEDADTLLQAKQTALQSTLNEISLQDTLLLQNQNILASLQTSLATSQDEYNLLSQKLQQEIANQQLNSQEIADKQLEMQQQEVVVTDIQNQIYSSQNLQADIQSDINSLAVQYNQLAQSIELINTQISLKTQHADELALQIQNYESTLLSLEQTLTTDQASLATANQQIIESQGLLAAQNDLIAGLQADLASEQANLDDLNALLDAELATQQVSSQELTDLENQIATQTTIVTGLQADITESQYLQATLQQGTTTDTILINQLEQNIANTESATALKTYQMSILQTDLADAENDIYLKEEVIVQKQLISDDFEGEIEILNSKINTKSIELQQNQILIDEKEVQINAESENYATLQGHKTLEEVHLVDLQGELLVLMIGFEANAVEIEEKRIEIDNSQILISDYNAQITVSEQTIQTYLVEKDSLVNTQKSLQKSYDNLIARCDHKQAEKADVDAIIAVMNDDLQTLNDAKSLIESDILTLTNDISNLNDDLAGYQQSLYDANTALATKQTELDATTTLLATLEQDLILEQQTLQQLNQDHQILLAELSENNDVINNYLAHISAAEATLANFNAQIQAAIADRTTIQNTLDQQNIQASSLNDAISSTLDQTSLVTTQKGQAQLQLQSLHGEILNLQQNVADNEASQQSISDAITLKKGLLADEINLEESLEISLATEQTFLDQLNVEYNQILSDLSQNNEVVSNLMISVYDKQAEIAQIQTDITNTQASILSIQTILSDLNFNKQLYQDGIASITQQITLLESQQEQANTAITSLQATLDTLNLDKTYYETLSADISPQIVANRQTDNVLQDELAAFTIQEQNYADEVTAIQIQITSYENQIATIQPKITAQENLIASLTLDKQIYEKEVADMRSQLLANKQSQAGLQTSLDQALLNEQMLASTVAELQTQKTALEGSITQIGLQIDTLNADIAALSDSQLYNEAELANAQSLQATNYETKINLQSSLDTLSQQHDQALVDISTLEASIAACNLQIPQLEADMSSMEASVGELNILKTTKEGELSSLGITEAQQILDDKNIYIAEQEQILLTKQTEFVAASAELDAALQNIDQSQQNLDSLMQEKTSIETQITQNTQILKTSQNDLVATDTELTDLIALKDSKLELKQTLSLQLTQQQTAAVDTQTQINEYSASLQTLEESYNTFNIKLNDLNALLQSNTLLAENTYTQIQELESEQLYYQQEIDSLATNIQNYEQSIQDINLLQQQTVTVHIVTKPNDINALLTVEKKVFDESTGNWEETTIVEENETVRFRIDVENVGEIDLIRLVITDVLPTDILSYNGNATPHQPDTHQDSLLWKFESFNIGDTIRIEFDALAINTGVNDNLASAVGYFLVSNINQEFSVRNNDTSGVTALPKPVNNPPVANLDYYDVLKNSVDNVLNVLENDTDEDPADTVKIEQVSDPKNGTIKYSQDYIYYTPNTGFTGQDSFEYTISDNSEEKDVAEVYINVLETNHPSIANDDYYNILEDSVDNTLDVLSNDTDEDEDSLTLVSINSGPYNGDAYVSGDNILYTPDANYSGTDTLSYTISDGLEQDTAEVTIYMQNINDNPVAVDDNSHTPVNTSLEITILENDYDVDEDALTIEGIELQPLHGEVSINSYSVSYTPDISYSGSDSFVYKISDGNGAYSTATVYIDVYVIYVNHPPVAADDIEAVFENSANNIINVLINDHDVDDDLLSINKIQENPSNGTVKITADMLKYTPNTGFVGTDSFSYNITDNNGNYDLGTVTVIVDEKTTDIIKRPERGVLYIWDRPMFEISPFLDNVGYETLIVGPINIEVEVNETEFFEVEKVEYYVNNELKYNTTKNHSFIFNELIFNIATIKVIAYGNSESITEEIDAFIINFGLFIQNSGINEK